MKTDKPKPQVVVVGGGFGGIATVQRLRDRGVASDITLVSRTDTFEYYPALYKLVTGALAIEASVPLKKVKGMSNVGIEYGTFTGVDPQRQVITLQSGEGSSREISYDYLVLALGSETNYFGITGLPEFSFSFKSVKEAFRLKKHFCELFSQAKAMPKEEAVATLHTVIVGGGPSGVELAGDLMDYLRGLAREVKVDPSLITIDLLEAAGRLLPMMPEKASALAETRLRTLGVNIFLNRALKAQDIDGIFMGDMQLKSSTVVWTAGTRINTAYDAIPGVELSERKRITVDEYLALPHHKHIFVIGDGAATPYSGLAQTAITDGKFLGGHLARMIKGKKLKAYEPKKNSYVVPIGTGWAIFVTGTRVFTGFIPWLLRSAVDFHYFLSLVPLWHVFAVFRHGAKYRKSKTYCPVD